MIDPKEVLALFDTPDKNQGLILHYAYQAMPDLATEVIRLREIERAAREAFRQIDLRTHTHSLDMGGKHGVTIRVKQGDLEYWDAVNAYNKALGVERSGERGQ